MILEHWCSIPLLLFRDDFVVCCGCRGGSLEEVLVLLVAVVWLVFIRVFPCDAKSFNVGIKYDK